MRLDVSGAILVFAGICLILLVTNIAVKLGTDMLGWLIMLLLGVGFFIGWLMIISGANNINAVRKDKKARKPKDRNVERA